MRLDVREIMNRPGTTTRFSEAIDCSDVDFGGVCPAVKPVTVKGAVRNIAGMLQLNMDVGTVLSCVCDRCATRYDREFFVSVERLLSDTPEETENDDILLLDDGFLDIQEEARELLILHMDTKFLCREDCRGLCPGCGANLNTEVCRCKKITDPRWEALRQLLE